MTMFIETPVGTIGLRELNGALSEVLLPGSFQPEASEPTPLLLQAARQLGLYFKGALREFDLPLLLAGTPFQAAVWRELMKIPYGETAGYGEIAAAIGKPKAARAVGMANHRNPLSIVVPCHRVIGADGKLVGYGGGLELKRRLLELEKRYSGRANEELPL